MDSDTDPSSTSRRRRRRSTRHGNEDGGERPFFERLEEANGNMDKRDDYVRRLEMQLDEYKRLADESKRRLSALEYINDDLEKRLETEAARKLDLDRQLQSSKDAHKHERGILTERIETLESQLRDRAAQETTLNEKLRRIEKELYRMHQRKHEIVQQVRRQEAEDRAADQEASQRIRAQAAARTGQDSVNLETGSSSQGPQTTPNADRNLQSDQRARRQQNQDEAMAVAYFSQPSSALAEQQHRFRMAESLGHFFCMQ